MGDSCDTVIGHFLFPKSHDIKQYIPVTSDYCNHFKCYIMRYYVWAFYAKFSHQCFQPILFGSVFTRIIFVGSL